MLIVLPVFYQFGTESIYRLWVGVKGIGGEAFPHIVINICILTRTQGCISIKDLSDMSAIKTEDILSTLQQLNLIQYVKGQHVIYAHPKVVDKCLKQLNHEGWDL